MVRQVWWALPVLRELGLRVRLVRLEWVRLGLLGQPGRLVSEPPEPPGQLARLVRPVLALPDLLVSAQQERPVRQGRQHSSTCVTTTPALAIPRRGRSPQALAWSTCRLSVVGVVGVVVQRS